MHLVKAKLTHNKVVEVITTTGIILSLFTYIFFNNYDYSVDVQTLYDKTNYECTNDGLYHYHKHIEYFITILAKTGLSCDYTYEHFQKILISFVYIFFIMSFIFLYQLKNKLYAYIYFVVGLLLSSPWMFSHLFRQIAASYLMLCWFLSADKKFLRYVIPLAALSLHASTALVLMMGYVLITNRRKNNIFFLIPLLIGSLLALSDLVVSYVEEHHGFLFVGPEYYSEDSYTLAFWRTFSLALLIGLVEFILTKRSITLLVSFLALLSSYLAIIFQIDSQVYVRLGVYLRFIFIPILISISISRILSILMTRKFLHRSGC
jgi:hypothetical protein